MRVAIYAVGDIQGCFIELERLLKSVKFDPCIDTLWLVGDLVNRGPASLETLRFVKDLGDSAVTVLGNHDLNLLAVAHGAKRLHRRDTLKAVLDAPDASELLTWLRYRPIMHRDAERNVAMVHAGIPPIWTLNEAMERAEEVEKVLQGPEMGQFLGNMYGDQPDQWDESLSGWARLRLISNYLTRMRFCDARGKLDLATKDAVTSDRPGFRPWFEHPHRKTRDLHVVFGHWAALMGRVDDPHLFALDTGCVWGGTLTAVRLDDTTWYHVPAACEQRPCPFH